MKTFKLFSRTIAVFGFMMMLTIPAWAVCPVGSDMGTWNATSGSTYNNHSGVVQSDDADYYTITNPVGGQINLSIKNNTSNRQLTAFLYSDSTCTASAVWSSGTVAGSATVTATVDVTLGTTYYLYIVGSASNQDTAYTLNANKPAKGHAVLHENPFVPVFPNGGLKLFGDFASTGDSVLCQNNGSGGCNNNYSGYLYNSNLIYKNEGSMTLNSASSVLTLPANVAGTEIEWAGLYWQGHIADKDATKYATSTMVQNRGNVSFRLPDGTTQNVTADKVWYHDFWGDTTGSGIGFRSFYQGYKDVTADVKAHLVGGTLQTFTVGNIKANNGADWMAYAYVSPGVEGSSFQFGFWGNWSLIVVYKHNPATLPVGAKLKNINVFNGFDAMIPLPVQPVHAVTLPINGFLTPKSGTVNAKMLFYASGGEQAIQRDAFYIQNANASYAYQAVSNAVNPINNPFNGSVSNLGVPVDAAISYYPGLDLDTYDVSSYMKNDQTSTSLKLEATFSGNNGDQSTPGAIAFSNDLYTPSFCYDYGYEQNGVPFTEENNGFEMPYVRGHLPSTSDINVSIYIRNKENSDVSANNVRLNINDINTSQAMYQRNSVAVTFPDAYLPIAKTDAAWPVSVDDAYVHNIPLGDIAGNKYAYAYYGLTPVGVGDINMPIVGTFSYDLTIPLANGTVLTFPYSSTIGGTGLPMCSVENFSYTPIWGIFSMVDAGLYDSATANRYYNLTTQVAKRPGNLRIAAFDANLTDTPKALSTTVAVELIDASLFHDVDAACHEPSSAVTPRVWVTFDNNVSQVNFNKATIDMAIANGMVSDGITGAAITLANAEDFFKTATKNAAFRVSYNVTNDGNDSLIQTAPGTPATNTQILNFTQLVQDIGQCSQPVEIPNNPSNTTMNVAVACGNAGNQGIDKHNLAICMECLYGYNTNILCSRDNFAIRPESYTVNLKDVNQTNGVKLSSFATDHTGVLTPNTDRVNMAGGYIYNYEINATNHIDNTNTERYNRNFSGASNDFNITFVWEPTTSKTGCNDTSSLPQNFYMYNGAVVADGSMGNVGEYRLNIIDKTWTAVDWDPLMQGHQTGSHFLAGDDCLLGSTIVPLQADVTSLNGGTIDNLVGCNISSTHNNAENSLKYRDYLMTFHPHHFNVNLAHGLGLTAAAIVAGGDEFVYDADLANANDMNMSLRSTGTISAVGFAGNQLNNFVKECYAKDLNVTMGHNANTAMATPFVSRVVYSSAAGVQVFDSNKTNVAANVMKTTVDDSNFTKVDNGAVGTLIRLNFDRNTTTPLDPQRVEYKDINVTCTVAGECSRQADGAVGDADGTALMDFNVTHVYGRIGTLNVRATKNTPFNAFAYYEVYNAPNLLNVAPSLTEYPAGSQWYINTLHDSESKDGNMSIEFVLTGGANPTATLYDTNGTKTYSFPGYSVSGNYTAHINTEGWLWYAPNALGYLEPVNPTAVDCLTHPCFNIRIGNLVGRTGSAETVSESTKDNKNSTSTGWRSTSDYAPAIR